MSKREPERTVLTEAASTGAGNGTEVVAPGEEEADPEGLLAPDAEDPDAEGSGAPLGRVPGAAGVSSPVASRPWWARAANTPLTSPSTSAATTSSATTGTSRRFSPTGPRSLPDRYAQSCLVRTPGRHLRRRCDAPSRPV